MLRLMGQLRVGLVLLAMGCDVDGRCAGTGQSRTVTTGTTDLNSLTYVSAPWDGQLEELGPRSTLTFVHGLGVVPDLVTSYVSFTRDGTSDSEVTENTGNQGEITCVDENVVVVENGTCATFFIRVVAARLGDTGTQSGETCGSF